MVPQSVRFGVLSRKLSNIVHWMGDQKFVILAPSCFGKHVQSLVPAIFAVSTSPYWARMVGYGPFSFVIHKEGLSSSSGDINRAMTMMIYT
jgi:hypothetical protein